MSSHGDLDLWPSQVIFVSDIGSGYHYSSQWILGVNCHYSLKYGPECDIQHDISYHCPTPKMTKSKNLSGAIAPSFTDQSPSYFTVRCRMTYSTINLHDIFRNSHSPVVYRQNSLYGHIMSVNENAPSRCGIWIHIIISHLHGQYHRDWSRNDWDMRCQSFN